MSPQVNGSNPYPFSSLTYRSVIVHKQQPQLVCQSKKVLSNNLQG